MTERKIVIKTCEECPFNLLVKGMIFCVKEERESETPDQAIPEWCPLEENKKCQ